MSRSRKSQAEAKRIAHRVAAYSQWVTAQIRESLDDPRPSMPHDEVVVAMDAEIAAIDAERAATTRGSR